MIGAGMSLVSAGLLLVVALSSADASALALAPGLLVIGTGIGLTIPNAAAAGIATVAADEMGKASGVVSTARQVGSVFGVSVALALFQSASASGGAAAIVHPGLLAGALGAAAGAVIAAAERLELSRRLMPARSEV